MEGKWVWHLGGTEKKINLEEKKTKLEERRFELTAALEETKMLTIKMDELDPDVVMIMRAIRVRMLKRLAADLEGSGGEEEPAAQ